MITFKCKMCGGDLRPEENATTCECEYCGSVQTIPTADNEKKGNLFNRANRLRMAAEYDKAAAVYTSITAEFPEEAEAYWGLCLCKYGIEYVEDPVTAKKIPTCHRTRSDSIMDDPDFDQTCENADAIAERVYREEAKAIDRLQRDILSVVANESPYDVFICYKETDDNGERTEDSVLAQDIYDALTAKGLKVFFARITLEDKLGQQYEPYIYAALHSAKVMLSIGTQYEYFDAVWVKNEWARFLDMMKTDKSKTLIPCYKGIDAYDMPREFKNLQAQDMAKLGWLQDLTRGVMKLCGKDTETVKPVVAAQPQYSSPTVDSLLKRTFVFLEDGEWNNAVNYADKVLDIDVENGRAYLAKLMAEMKVRKEADLKNQPQPYDNSEHYQKIMRFGDDALKAQVSGDIEFINDRIERDRQKAQQLEIRQAEAQEKVEAIRKVAEEKANTLRTAYGVQMRDFQDAINRAKAVEADLHKAQQEYENTKTAISQMQSELNNLRGIFTGKRKRELETRINTHVSSVKNMETKIALLENRYIEVCTEKPEPPVIPDLPDERETIYQCAGIYAEAELYLLAYTEYNKIRGYKDVNTLLANDDTFATAAARDVAFSVGKTVTIGTYPQKSIGTGKTPIEWLVLARDGQKALLLSKYGLDSKPYNTERIDITWEDCTLRKWLNNDFLKAAFSPEEQKGIVLTNVDNSKSQGYSGWSTKGGNNTQDKVFLLSYNETLTYFGSENARLCAPTDYAIEQGTITSNTYKVDGRGTGMWWLRSPGNYQDCAACVDSDGYRFPTNVNDDIACVRPAFWANLESGIF